jgi:hypothetical protein
MVARASEPILIVHPDITMSDNQRTLVDILASLAAADASHVLVGGLVAGYYGKPRATVDVDMLVPKRSAAKIHAEMSRRGYTAERGIDMVRFYRPGTAESVADMMWTSAHPVLKAASAHTVGGIILEQPVTVVARGAFVALKYHAAASPTRDQADKHMDIADLMHTVNKAFSAEDEALAVKVAEKSYRGGGKDLAHVIDDIRAKRIVRI